HPLYELLDTLGAVIHAYEEQHYPIPESTSGDMIQFFMDEQRLLPSELPEIGSEQTVQAILDGTRELTVSQIRAISQRFHVSPAVFI
ncbi:MAG: transcriptional regulator, partial [Desulfobulbaceae bacterium]|nr:transcriptional regulator [Desulfobulbaceae bacterium]